MERRLRVRRVPEPDEGLSRMRLRTGAELMVVNVSDTGALVESAARLLPGTRVDVHVVARHGRVLVRCRVVRAWVSAVAADAIRYRGAFLFDQPIAAAPPGYRLPGDPHPSAGDEGSPYPGPSGTPIAAT